MAVKKQELKDVLQVMLNSRNNLEMGNRLEEIWQEPLNIMICHQLMQYSKEELENTHITRWSENAYKISVRYKNVALMSVLWEKGIGLSDLSLECQWLLKQNKDKENGLYECVLLTQLNYFPFIYNLLNYTKELNTAQKSTILDNFYDKYSPNENEEILKNCFIKSDSEGARKIVSKMIEDGKDIHLLGKCLMNNLLPKKQHEKDFFFIDDKNRSKIKDLLAMGFKFDEQSYRFNDDILLTNILKTKNMEIIKIILPELKMAIPTKTSLEEQHRIINGYNQSSKDFINSYYQPLLMENYDKKLDKKDIKPSRKI